MAANEGEPTQLLNYSLDPAEQLVLTIFFNPISNIEYTDNVFITSNDPSNPEVIIYVNGIGQGVSNEDNNMIPQVTALQGNYPKIGRASCRERV